MRHICMPSPRTIVMALATSSRADVVPVVSGVVHEDRPGDRWGEGATATGAGANRERRWRHRRRAHARWVIAHFLFVYPFGWRQSMLWRLVEKFFTVCVCAWALVHCGFAFWVRADCTWNLWRHVAMVRQYRSDACVTSECCQDIVRSVIFCAYMYKGVVNPVHSVLSKNLNLLHVHLSTVAWYMYSYNAYSIRTNKWQAHNPFQISLPCGRAQTCPLYHKNIFLVYTILKMSSAVLAEEAGEGTAIACAWLICSNIVRIQ